MTAIWALLSGAATKVGEYLITWEVPSGIALLALLLGAGGTLYMEGRLDDTQRLVQKTVRDTVQRQITRRDTVTETRPVRVTVYDTVRTEKVDTMWIPIPSQMDYRGVTTDQPIQVDGLEVTLTEWRPDAGRWVQSTYRARPDPWSIDIEGALSAGVTPFGLRTVGATETIGLSYSEGPWTVRGAGGVATTLSAERLDMVAIGEVAVSYELTGWRGLPW